jgi:hypothetical protein
VAKAEFTYEVRKLPTEPTWIEDYVVRARGGDSIGTVGGVLEHEGERLLVVERGVVTVAQDRRAVPWSQVERIDHDAVAVWLALDEATFDSEALELDPGRAVEEGEAEARRVSRPPEEELPSPRAAGGGPVDRSTAVVALSLAGLGAFLALVVVVLITAADSAWPAIFFVGPAALFVTAAALGYRAYRNPYESRGAAKP